MILGLDLSATRTGWARLPLDGGFENYGSWRFPKTDPPGLRWVKFGEKLNALHELEPFDAIAYEKVMLRVQTGPSANGPAAHVYGALLCVVEMFAARYKIPLYPIHIMTAKKTAGSGRFKKQEMIDAAMKHWDLSIVNHDEADAFWVAETARRKINAAA